MKRMRAGEARKRRQVEQRARYREETDDKQPFKQSQKGHLDGNNPHEDDERGKRRRLRRKQQQKGPQSKRKRANAGRNGRITKHQPKTKQKTEGDQRGRTAHGKESSGQEWSREEARS